MKTSTYTKLLAFGILNIITLIGCVPVGGPTIEKDVVEMKNRVGSLESTLNKTTSAQLATTSAKAQNLEEEVNRLKGRMDTLEVAMKTGSIPGSVEDEFSQPTSLPARVKELESIVNMLQNKYSSAPQAKQKDVLITPNKPAATTTQVIVGINGLRNAFTKKKYSFIIANAGFALKNAESKDKAEIIYLKARSHHFKNQTREAALLFDEFIKSKPTNKNDIAQAKLYLGDCFKKLGDKKTAKIYYQEVKTGFKNTIYSKAAQRRLTNI